MHCVLLWAFGTVIVFHTAIWIVVSLIGAFFKFPCDFAGDGECNAKVFFFYPFLVILGFVALLYEMK